MMATVCYLGQMEVQVEKCLDIRIVEAICNSLFPIFILLDHNKLDREQQPFPKGLTDKSSTIIHTLGKF